MGPVGCQESPGLRGFASDGPERWSGVLLASGLCGTGAHAAQTRVARVPPRGGSPHLQLVHVVDLVWQRADADGQARLLHLGARGEGRVCLSRCAAARGRLRLQRKAEGLLLLLLCSGNATPAPLQPCSRPPSCSCCSCCLHRPRWSPFARTWSWKKRTLRASSSQRLTCGTGARAPGAVRSAARSTRRTAADHAAPAPPASLSRRSAPDWRKCAGTRSFRRSGP